MNKKHKKIDRQKNERTCIVCRKFLPKHSMYRLVKCSSGQIELDINQTMQGRGSYICGVECVNLLEKQKCLHRTYKCNIDSNVYQNIVISVREIVDNIASYSYI